MKMALQQQPGLSDLSIVPEEHSSLNKNILHDGQSMDETRHMAILNNKGSIHLDLILRVVIVILWEIMSTKIRQQLFKFYWRRTSDTWSVIVRKKRSGLFGNSMIFGLCRLIFESIIHSVYQLVKSLSLRKQKTQEEGRRRIGRGVRIEKILSIMISVNLI